MNAIKANLLNQISPIIENQLYLSCGHCGAQKVGVGEQFRL